MEIGVLALQGAFREHIAMLGRIPGVHAFPVRREEELARADGLILPGGESTVMGKLLQGLGLTEPLRRRIEAGFPVWGTCAGLILLAKRLEGGEAPHLAVMDITVKRNAYGRQIDSFAAEEEVPFLGGRHPLIFIRAPYITEVRGHAHALLTLGGHIVAAEEGNRFVTAFHPELGNDTAFHEYFAEKVRASMVQAGA